MAYNYEPTYNKRRKELIQKRAELKKMGVPLSSLPQLPKKPKIITKESSKILRETLADTKDYYKAQKILNKNPDLANVIDVSELAYQQKKKRRSKSKRNRNPYDDYINIYKQYFDAFEEKLAQIHVFKWVAKGYDFSGADILGQWWESMKSQYSQEELGKFVKDAEDEGIILDSSVAYKASYAKQFIYSFMDSVRRHKYISDDDYYRFSEEYDDEISTWDDGEEYES